MQVQGPYTSISAFDRGDDYDDYGVCVAYVFVHPEGNSLASNGRGACEFCRSQRARGCVCSTCLSNVLEMARVAALAVFESGTVIKAGEQLPTQQILAHCQPIVKTVRGWRSTPIFARSEWWQQQKHPVTLPEPVCEVWSEALFRMPKLEHAW